MAVSTSGKESQKTGQDLQEGQQIAGYQIITTRPIGAAEFEAVARTSEGETVALHMLDWNRLMLQYRARFFREAEQRSEVPEVDAIAAHAQAKCFAKDAEYRKGKERALGFQHPHMATIRKLGTLPTTRQTFVETDYVPGAPLLQEAQGMKWSQRLYFLPPLLEALQGMHDRGYLHGNLKHRRIRAVFQDGRPVAKLIDPGFCVPMHQWPTTLVGTAEFLPPEILFQQTDQIDQRADLYMFGHLMYTLFADGRYAMGYRKDAGKDLKQLKAIMETESTPLPPSTYVRDLPKPLDDLVVALLEREPAKRQFTSATDVLTYLQEHWPEACTELQTTALTVSIESQMA